jgi:hypothetical protein
MLLVVLVVLLLVIMLLAVGVGYSDDGLVGIDGSVGVVGAGY